MWGNATHISRSLALRSLALRRSARALATSAESSVATLFAPTPDDDSRGQRTGTPLPAPLEGTDPSPVFEDDLDPADDLFVSEQARPGTRFRLSPRFLAKYEGTKPPFGFNGLGELVFLRTYSRARPDGQLETWPQTVERVVNGTYNMQKRWIEQHELGWNAWRAQRSAQEMFDRIFHMKFLPPGRGLWAMGSPITEDRQLYAALNNCAFVSTEALREKSREDPSRPFCFLMDAAMLGVGVGFDTVAATVPAPLVVKGPNAALPPLTHVVEDSRQGWVQSLSVLLNAHFLGKAPVHFDYSDIRPAGAPISGFGGVAAGPACLSALHEEVQATLQANAGAPISVTTIVDIMNQVGKCVVSGNVRRTAEIAFGAPDSDEFLDLKSMAVNPHRASWAWTSNNSVFAELGMDYAPAAARIAENGEPGFAWLDNMRAYGRMGDPPNHLDSRAMGGNPCLEQTLESYELCCLVETFPNNHADLADYKRTLKFAYLYAKTVTLGRTHWPLTNRVLLRNRRIGASMSGIAQFVASRGLDELATWADEGYTALQEYDRKYSDWLAIPRSIKTTCIKPSGTVSLLAGATPGMHYPESRFYLRRVRVPNASPLLQPLRQAGYHVEPSVMEPDTAVVSFPIDVGEGVRTAPEVSMWEQLSLAAFLQRHWADNQVSCTVTFDPEREAHHIPHALDFFQYQLKGVSFLPRDNGSYQQMPYEAISQQQYEEAVARIAQSPPLDFTGATMAPSPAQQAVPDLYCEADKCEVRPAPVVEPER